MEHIIQPLGNRVVTKVNNIVEDMVNGLYLPSALKVTNATKELIVVALGTGALDDKGNKIPFEVNIGDRVIADSYSGTKLELDGVEYIIYEATHLVAIINKKENK